MAETQNIEKKMGGESTAGGSLGVSVSFGKYENDDAAALCWEKWSTFSPNKYLEEVGKCSTPGSVAQKKAFFEAHYKKIAAMKAEELLLDQEKPPPDQVALHFEETKEEEEDIIKESKAVVCLNQEEEQVQAEISSIIDGSGKPQEDTCQSRYCKEEASLPNDERFEDESLQSGNEVPPQNLLQSQSPITTFNSINADKKLEEAVLVNDETQHFQVDLETRCPQQEIPKPKAQNALRKLNPTKVEKNSIGMNKKPAYETSATRLSKPKATPTSSLKQANASSSSSLSKSKKNHLVSESKRVAPTSLHLSMSMISMNSVNSDTASSSVTSSRRRSLFMEQMGDKDIVKRAFKTFQNRVNQLPSFDSGTKHQLPAKGSETKASTSRPYQKENERTRKAGEKITPARGHLGPTWKSVSSGSFKGVGVYERRIKATSNSVVSISNERRKEFLKNLEETSNAREAEKSQLSSKSKQVKDAQMKTLWQKNLSFKAKPMPSFYRAQGVSSKSSSGKEAIKQT